MQDKTYKQQKTTRNNINEKQKAGFESCEKGAG